MLDGWWFASAWEQSPALAISWVFWVIVSIVLHELAHGWAAIRLGDTTPIEYGRMTWNPLVHMGRTSLIVFAIVGIAWGLMPVTPSRLRGRHGDAIVSAAGPMMNVLLAVICMILGGQWTGLGGFGVADPLNFNIRVFFLAGASLNVFLMLFNLLPIPPLDGSRIMISFWPRFATWMNTQQAQFAMLGLFAVVFFWGADYLFSYAFLAGTQGIRFIASLVP